LELAAFAAGYNKFEGHAIQIIDSGWNPLFDDGYALRLAVKMDIFSSAYIHPNIAMEAHRNGGDWLSATRRAIVESAAEIGRQMKGA